MAHKPIYPDFLDKQEKLTKIYGMKGDSQGYRFNEAQLVCVGSWCMPTHEPMEGWGIKIIKPFRGETFEYFDTRIYSKKLPLAPNERWQYYYRKAHLAAWMKQYDKEKKS